MSACAKNRASSQFHDRQLHNAMLSSLSTRYEWSKLAWEAIATQERFSALPDMMNFVLSMPDCQPPTQVIL